MSDPRKSGPDVPFDRALEREIEQALAVDPSPEFVARVRTRVAAEPASRFDVRLVRWAVVGGASLVAAGVAGALYLGLLERQADQPAGQAPPIVRVGPGPIGGGGQEQAPKRVQPPDAILRSPRTGRHVGVATAHPTGTGPIVRDDFPEVMVSAAEVEGYRQLLALARTGIRIAEAPAAGSGESVEKVKEITIEPIVITPFELARLEGVTE